MKLIEKIVSRATENVLLKKGANSLIKGMRGWFK